MAAMLALASATRNGWAQSFPRLECLGHVGRFGWMWLLLACGALSRGGVLDMIIHVSSWQKKKSLWGPLPWPSGAGFFW